MALSAKNKRFWAKTKAEQRVAIAKDVLKQISEKAMSPRIGRYAYFPREGRVILPETPLDKVLEEASKCTVCALGACFVSMVEMGNQMTVRDALKQEGINKRNTDRILQRELTYKILWVEEQNLRRRLRRIFSGQQLAMLECAFEMQTSFTQEASHLSYDKRVDLASKAMAWGKQFKTSRARLIAIMENIIANEGTFNPVITKEKGEVC